MSMLVEVLTISRFVKTVQCLTQKIFDYRDVHIHQYEYISISLDMCIYWIEDRQIYICQTDGDAFISVFRHVRICEYSLGRASHNFNKLSIKCGLSHYYLYLFCSFGFGIGTIPSMGRAETSLNFYE